MAHKLARLKGLKLYHHLQDNENNLSTKYQILVDPAVARVKARASGRSLAGIAGVNPAGGMDLCLL